MYAPDSFLVEWMTIKIPASALSSSIESQQEEEKKPVNDESAAAAAAEKTKEEAEKKIEETEEKKSDLVIVTNRDRLFRLVKYCLSMESDESLKYALTPMMVVFTHLITASPRVHETLQSWILDDQIEGVARK